MLDAVTLEMSLKPFKKTESEYMRTVIERLFKEWYILVSDAKEISVLLWVADGSEILDFSGRLTDELEWCRYVGGANRLEEKSRWDPDGIGLHSRAYFYMDDPPVFTYSKLAEIVALIKDIAHGFFPEKRIRVGATFDPGPEFAISKFKYKRHNEICAGSTMGRGSMVCCYARLHRDDREYAAFPHGIEEGLPFATFFGRQAECFLSAVGFDYLWFSNGFGFGLEPWSTTGALFDGKSFFSSSIDEAQKKILEFWSLFRKECKYRVETRGTNLTLGIDAATDGVPLKAIYNGGFNILPPPNSPWAALDSNFGLELAGYMSRICELPENEYLFRYYVHDPWWANTPWTDRYDSLPHDIYLPLSVCRLDENAASQAPTHLAILSTDNSFGEMPDYCAYEPSVHINRAKRYAPDAPSPVVWIYPFDEYCDARDERGIKEAFFGDWFTSGAINHGLPISSVISTKNFVSYVKNTSGSTLPSVFISTIPASKSEYERAIIEYVRRGGRVIFYGSVTEAGEDILSLIGVRLYENELFGDMDISVFEEYDNLLIGNHSKRINHRPLTSGGGINTYIPEGSRAVSIVEIGGRTAGVISGRIIWLNGTCSADYISGRLLTPDKESVYYSGESIMRHALDLMGYKIRFTKETADTAEPIISISRHENAYMIAASARDTTVKTRLKFPQGAPIPTGRETKIDADGFGEYYFTRSEFLECRVFVEQSGGVISCHDMSPGSFFRSRKIKVTGLNNATVRFFAPRYCETRIEGIYNSDDVASFLSEKYDGSYVTDELGTYFEARNVTGKMIFAIPVEKPHGSTKRVNDNVPNIN